MKRLMTQAKICKNQADPKCVPLSPNAHWLRPCTPKYIIQPQRSQMFVVHTQQSRMRTVDFLISVGFKSSARASKRAKDVQMMDITLNPRVAVREPSQSLRELKSVVVHAPQLPPEQVCQIPYSLVGDFDQSVMPVAITTKRKMANCHQASNARRSFNVSAIIKGTESLLDGSGGKRSRSVHDSIPNAHSRSGFGKALFLSALHHFLTIFFFRSRINMSGKPR